MSEPTTFYAFARTILTTMLTLALMSSLTEFKYKRKRIFITFCVYLCYVTISSWILIQLFGFFWFSKVFILTISIPAILLVYMLAKDNIPQAIFNYMTQINIALFITISVTLLGSVFHFHQLTELFFRFLAFTIVFLLELFFMRKPFRHMANTLKENWVILAFIPMSFTIATVLIGVFPNHYSNNLWRILYVYSLYFVMAVVYAVLFQTITMSYHTIRLEQEQELLFTQTEALSKQLTALTETKNKLSIYRHDMHHQFGAISILLQQQEYNAALEHITSYTKQITESNIPLYCNNSIINAMLTYYISQAKEKGFLVETTLDIPASLFLDSMELSAVFANAIDNVLNTRDYIKQFEKKVLKITCSCSPHFVLEIANTYYGQIDFDEEGFPVAKKMEQAIGSRSIAAFVKKYNGSIEYILEDGWFKLKILIQLLK